MKKIRIYLRIKYIYNNIWVRMHGFEYVISFQNNEHNGGKPRTVKTKLCSLNLLGHMPSDVTSNLNRFVNLWTNTMVTPSGQLGDLHMCSWNGSDKWEWIHFNSPTLKKWYELCPFQISHLSSSGWKTVCPPQVSNQISKYIKGRIK